jgi:hypothetical protein
MKAPLLENMDALGAAGAEPDDLALLAAAALGERDVELLGARADAIEFPMFNMTTGGLWRVGGTARTSCAGASNTVGVARFSMVVKVIQSPLLWQGIGQVPPRYAALKYQGRNYYDYARAGVEIPRAAREVDIAAIEVVDWAPPLAVLHVACGKGTYVRVLAEDIAAALGCCAHLAALRRTATGPFVLADAVTLDVLEAMAPAARDARLLPVDAPLGAMARIDVDAPAALALVQGKTVAVAGLAAGRYRCYATGARFLGVDEAAGGTLRSVRLARTDGGLAVV